LIGFYLAFMPLYVLGLMGMTRRLQHISDPSWQPLLLVAELGAVVIALGLLCQIVQLYVSIRTRESRRDLTGDPWDGRTLEWATSSPPPPYNFAVMPEVQSIDALWDMKQRGVVMGEPRFEAIEQTSVVVESGHVSVEQTDVVKVEPGYQAIEMPRNSPTGIVTAFFAVMLGFAGIWHIWWMAILGLLAAAVTALVFGWSENREFEISAAELERTERSRLGVGRAA
jgi:cytochrome o ubiquinol oxidase subunit 1